MNDKINILGINIDKVTINEAVDKIISLENKEGPSKVFTPNSEIIYLAKDDEEFKNVLNSSDINTADGIGVVYASKILNNPISERVAGYDVACKLLPYMNENKKKLFLFGGKPGVAETAKENILKMYPGIDICGTLNGYFDDSKSIVNAINESSADYVFVCLGAPKQEKWIYNNFSSFSKGIFLGIGGSLDVFAGTAKRAPQFFIKLNIEWLYRLLKTPSRIGRMMALPKFALCVLKSKRGNK